MNPLAWLISLVLPACGFPAAQGLPVPGQMDMSHIVRPASSNTALAAPIDFSPKPDIITPTYQAPAKTLFAIVQQVARDQPHTFLAADYPDVDQAHYVARSVVFNFPDLVTVQVRPESPDTSDLVLYSRSVYGESDLGVNRLRITTWISAIDEKLHSSSER